MLEAAVIKRLALQVGFHDCGVVPAEYCAVGAASLHRWLAAGFQADMHYMEHHQDLRSDPRLLLPGCRTVVSLVSAYKPDRTMQGTHRVAMYAYGQDYHEAIKQKLWQLLSALSERYPTLQGRPFVDTAPLFDKYWAVRAGLGWTGYNTLFIHPRHGSLVNLGVLLLCDEADCYDAPLRNAESNWLAPLCRDCMRCVEACPNHALTPQQVEGREVWQLDARRCNAYHTIENRAPRLPATLNLATYAFGCDCCQVACPYNHAAPSAQTVSPERIAMLEALPQADEAIFKRAVKHSAMSRIRFPQWQRNVKTTSSV